MVNFGLYSTGVLAQVNIGGSSGVILGIVIAVAGALLYFLRSIRPELSRDHDIFFAAVGLLCGFILIFQGWRLDPILQFGQFLLTGSTIFFALETIRLRGVATEQARRNTPIVDDERPVSRVYRAELDELEPYEEERYDNRRLRGYQDPRNKRRPPAAANSEYRRPNTRDSRDSRDTPERDRYNPRDDYRQQPPQRRSNTPTTAVQDSYDDWGEERESWREESTSPPQRRPRRPRPQQRPPQETRQENEAPRPPRKRRPRPSNESYRTTQEEEIIPTEYVDYQPIDELDNQPKDESKNRDESDDNKDSEVKNNLGNFDY